MQSSRFPLYPGMFIGQISFLTMTTPVDRPYGTPGLGSKYQDQEQPTESKVHLSFKPDRERVAQYGSAR